MKLKEIKCKKVIDFLCDNIEIDFDKECCEKIKNHVHECEMCKKYFDTLKITAKCYQNYNVDLSKESHQKLINKLGLEE
ncbi:MAG: hypothetical protein JW866_07725 [Ignavibacteriales bacterium]|nr:hypothetical protein [Ignavibacteriales bacterium]